MPEVNAEIKRILREHAGKKKIGTEAMLGILKDLQGQVIDEIGRAAIGSWDAYHLKKMLNAVEKAMAEFGLKAKKTLSAELDGSWDMGKELVEGPLAAGGIWTVFSLSTSSLKVLKDHAFYRFEGLSDAAWDRIRGELTLGILGGKTPQEVAQAIGKNLEDPSIFTSIGARAEAITRTEMGRVFSRAAQERMEDAARYVEGLEKQWIHSGHPKVPRPYHLALDGHHVPVNEPFLVGNVAMMFPRDPKAPVNEVINCGCSHVPYHKGWR